MTYIYDILDHPRIFNKPIFGKFYFHNASPHSLKICFWRNFEEFEKFQNLSWKKKSGKKESNEVF